MLGASECIGHFQFVSWPSTIKCGRRESKIVMCDKLVEIPEEKNSWQNKLWLEKIFLEDIFFPVKQYGDSIWAWWECRIQDGLAREKTTFDEMVEKYKGNGEFDEDRAIATLLQSDDVTNSMYAAMTVSVWAKMEHLLKTLEAVCKAALNLKKNKPNKFDMKKFVKFFQNEMNINLEELNNFAGINAIRILSNSFKHANGYYELNEKSHERIDEKLLILWHITEPEQKINDDIKIDFTKLPIQELTRCCNCFCNELISRIELNLNKKSTERNM